MSLCSSEKDKISFARRGSLSAGGTISADSSVLNKLQRDIVSTITGQVEMRHARVCQELNELRLAQDRLLGNLQMEMRDAIRLELGVTLGQLKADQQQAQESLLQQVQLQQEQQQALIASQPAFMQRLSVLPSKDVAGEASPPNGNAVEAVNGDDAPKTSTANAAIATPIDGMYEDAEGNLVKLGTPQGEFLGRPNLFAFLQAKQWDSKDAMDPGRTHGINNAVDSAPDPSCGGKYRRAIMSNNFDLFIGVLIVMNSLVMGLQLEYEGMFAADSVGVERDEEWPDASDVFKAMEHLFAIAFLLELLLRLSVMGLEYFKHFLNLMDTLIVVVSMLELYILADMDMGSIKLLRVFKIIRVLRILRLLKLFRRLRELLAAVMMSLPSLFWCMAILGIVQLIGAIFMTMSLQSYLQDEGQDQEAREQIYLMFGNFSRSCLTLYEMTLAIGTWSRIGRPVIFNVNRNYALFFIGYVTMISFGMMRVIAAIFLKETLHAASMDSDRITRDSNRNPDFVQKCWNVFNAIDETGGGSLNLQELIKASQDDSICAQLLAIGVVPQEIPGLFTLMDDGDDEISFSEFVVGVMRLKNMHKGVDLATLLFENKKILSRVLGVGKRVDRLREYVGEKNSKEAEEDDE